jgi:hypothetical protein
MEDAMRGRGVWDAERGQAALNVVGGAAFFVGSLLFLDSSLVRLGVALFVLGSLAMLLGSLAVWHERYAPGASRRAVTGHAAGPATAYVAPPVTAGPAVGVLDAAITDPALTSPAAPGSSPGSPPGG